MDQMTHHDHVRMANQDSGRASAQPAGAHDRHTGHSGAMFRDKFWLSFALTIPVVFLSSDVQHWFGYTVPSFPGSTLLVLCLACDFSSRTRNPIESSY
jgi:Cu2+-exporting ATPase